PAWSETPPRKNSRRVALRPPPTHSRQRPLLPPGTNLCTLTQLPSQTGPPQAGPVTRANVADAGPARRGFLSPLRGERSFLRRVLRAPAGQQSPHSPDVRTHGIRTATPFAQARAGPADHLRQARESDPAGPDRGPAPGSRS